MRYNILNQLFNLCVSTQHAASANAARCIGLCSTLHRASQHAASGFAARCVFGRSSQYIKSLYINTIVLALMMLVGSTHLWAQTDYSGTYYIGSSGWNAKNTTTNYYVCPTEGWCFYQATDDFTGTDNGMPFLTTYQCRNGVYEASKAVWTIEKAPAPNSDYYYIRQFSTGRYLVANGVIRTTSSGWDRMRVHLETIADPVAAGNKVLFNIYAYSSYLVIQPMGIDEPAGGFHSNHNNHKWLTVNNKNESSLIGVSGKTGGPDGYANTSGIIGVYTEDDKNGKFYLENAISIEPPTITNNFDGTITITSAAGATIYYTTNGSTPTQEAYTGIGTTSVTFSLEDGVTVIKAIAKGASDFAPTVPRIYNIPQCEKPVITLGGGNFTITCATEGSVIYYTTDDTPATTSSNVYSTPFPKGLISTVRAIATSPGYLESDEAILLPPVEVTSSSQITNMMGNYVLSSNFSSTASIGTSENPFRGTIDGNMITLSGLGHSLVSFADGATIRNVILDNVSISGNANGNAGAICDQATGSTRIYNCGVLSGSVGGSANVGGIVGLLDDYSRVINCYSYANITGGTNVGGIVGNNTYASNADDIRTMVMNCMFYGDITGGTNVSPVYGGQNINNLSNNGLNTFNYYAYNAAPSFKDREENASKKYNCALAVSDKYLTRFEFYRLLLNSNKKLAAFYATGSADNADDMAKWVLETADRTIVTPKPYPVLKSRFNELGETKVYPSIINMDVENAPDSVAAGANKGGKLGKSLTVYISGTGVTTSSLTIDRTDKDFDRFNYNYDKIQLPYFNDVGTGNYTGGNVVTGWKITGIEGGTDGTFTSSDTWGGYNFASRECTQKDLYSVSGRVFSQGAYYDVPYGVTSITIEPYWGKAAYVADANYDVVYNDGYASPTGHLGTQVTSDTEFNGQKVYSNIKDALATLNNGSTVYDNAIVLVGNLHQNTVPSDGDKAFTVMSVDWDNDHEPDYSMIYHHNGRTKISPIRFDFINIPGTAQAQKPNGSTTLLNFTIFKTRGWFETTNTCLVYSNQVEYENQQNVTKLENSPLILLGGDFEQFVSTQSTAVQGRTNYIHVGGNVMIDQFGLGTHSDGNQSTPHIPVSVTGGQYNGFYLSGTYNQDAIVRTGDNAECYISSGYFDELAGACQEKIDGNVRWQIYNADINNFYGGGINAARPVSGNVDVDIYNSHVGVYCGGPKFGDMQTGKKVTTNAYGCVFGKYFGAGYGGTSYSRKKYYDNSGSQNWTTLQNYYATNDRGKYFDGQTTQSSQTGKDYGRKGLGVATDFDYEFFVWSTGQTGARFFVKFASFSLATCNDVESNLECCTINGNFYGGGSFGEVKGTAKSKLDGCTVNGNVFGGGYSATLPTIPVRAAGFTVSPKFNSSSGMFEPGEFSATEPYDWHQVDNLPANGAIGSNHSEKYIVTDVDLTALGKVANTDLTVTGNTYVQGSVFGGGDESGVMEDTKVDVQTTGERTITNVYGGGNVADVEGSADVTMTSGVVTQDIFGGGKGETTVVGGDVTVNFGKDTGEGYEGTGRVRDIYGGSALGAVNAKKEDESIIYSGTDETPKVTNVNIYSGTINGSVYGGGLGETSPASLVAKNFGTTTVTMQGGTVRHAVYGGSNVNGVLKRDAIVTVNGGTLNVAPDVDDPIEDVVFGGGKGEPTLVEGNITVNIGTLTAGPAYTGTSVIYGNVYGGSALGNVNAYRNSSSELVVNADKTTNVNLYGGTIHGNVFGGGLGEKPSVEPAKPGVEAIVGGDVNVLLDGVKLMSRYTGEGDNRTPVTGQIFGCNNLNGTPRGHVKVHVKRTVDSDKSSEAALAKTGVERSTYDVAAVYGGGNQADYVPTKAISGDENIRNQAFAEVIIEGCDETSIEYVYGGGNAAAVPATDVTILGTYIIDYVFGGGNGKGLGNPGANIGLYNNGAEYGSGKAVTKLVGGHIHYVFGGSNTLGNVRGGTTITMPEKDPLYTEYDCCDVREIKEIYGAGNQAEQDGPVSLILGCVDNMQYVYGGARNADVKGGVDLVITSGHFKGVYGGNDTSGTIQGPITVTIEETGCDPLVIDNLYLGGKDAAYSIYGYKDVAGVLVPRTETEFNELTDDQKTALGLPYGDPVLNIVSCTSIGNVFGGGLGATAVMYGSPTVNVNMIKGNQAGLDNTIYLPREYEAIPNIQDVNIVDEYTISCKIKNEIGSIGNVYGGGSAANVIGDTQINICTEENVAVRSTMGAPIDLGDRTPQPVEGAMITGNVFGAGLGLETVVNNTTIVMQGGNVKKSIYGGGELGSVNEDSHITITGGEVGDPTVERGGATIGNVYGGGKGLLDTEHLDAGLIKGNTTINISGGSIYHNIYGGGAYGSVGTYDYDPGTGANVRHDNTGTANITITGGTIGINGKENGMVFGSSRGDVAVPSYGSPAIDPNNLLAWVYETNVTIGTQNDETPGPAIKGSVYGSGENGHTFNATTVTIYSGTIGVNSDEVVEYKDNPNDPDEVTYSGKAYDYPYRGNVYGGGCGTDMFDSDSDGTDDSYNPESGIVRGSSTVTIYGGTIVRHVYGGGAMGSVNGLATVDIRSGSIGAEGSNGGYVYAGARGDETITDDAKQAYVGSADLIVRGGTVNGDAFGGGQAGIVKGAVTVELTGGTLKRDVYGGGALANTNTDYASGSAPANTYVTNVTLAGATVNGKLFGGGLGSNTVAADVNGPLKVSVTSGSASDVFGCNNINGAPQTTVDLEIGAKDGGGALSGSATISGSVYGGGKDAAYTGDITVKLYGGTINNNLYGGGLGATATVTGSTSVTMEGGTVGNDLYGGGSQADVTGNVSVSIGGGKVTHDVYGGGALANTNTANWNGDGSIQYVALTVKADPTDDELAAGVLKTDVTPVAGYFTESAGDYTRITSPEAKAQDGTTYYKKVVSGTWADGMNDPSTGTTYKTTVSLTGGIIANAYGGGLGSSAKAANVYGDVTVTVNEGVSDPTKGVVFSQYTEHVLIGGTDYPTPTQGRVFGCNNFNGTPTGEVTVHVYSTRQIRKDTESEILPGHGSGDRKYTYEIQAVYGGGDQADYLPATGKKSHVIIDGCDVTSIEKVYGGGNSAVVPETDVLIRGGFDIGYGFGGGNGGRPIKKENGVWNENEGAIVIGTARIECRGGKIGSVFGGGDSKGSCGNPNPIIGEEGTGDCPLHITRLYGAGNEGDASHVNIILAACSGKAIEYVHGGSYNAHVHGDVMLTITSGIYKNVFGGNDSEGGIEGDITINIEETDGCKPIIIQNLVGGGNEAEYPGSLKEGSVETPIDRHGKITVNVKSATRIDNVYGGSFNAEANADTEININMIKGNKANNIVEIPKEFSYIPNIHSISDVDSKTIRCTIDDAIGTIGNVFGGGKEGLVKGNTQVNIHSAAKVYIMKRNGEGKVLDTEGNTIDAGSGENILAGITIDCTDEHDAEGAHITGDVFGGGENANVTGNTEVYICANKTGVGTYTPISDAASANVSIGESVYGGGSSADVLSNTRVTMAGGYVFDGVYGGGLHGTVGTVTARASLPAGHPTHPGCLGGGKPETFAANTGKCTVVIGGGQVGPVEVALPDGGMLNTAGYYKNPGDEPGPVDYGFVFGAGRGEVEDPAAVPDADFHTFVKETEVTISGGLVMASVYGGGENGRVLGNTLVKIQGGQIGCGKNQYNEDGEGNPTTGKPYTSTQWENAIAAVESGDADNIEAYAALMPECSHYDFGYDVDGDGILDFVPYDPYYEEPKYATSRYDLASTSHPSDGKTYYGCVFGGGSGYYPYEKADGSGYEWLRSAGKVYGNTEVQMTGGHVLTNVYGGNEYTDIDGSCTITMSGGTIGVPRTLSEIAAHPVTCYLFGAGKGDPRLHFNQWTNVGSANVSVTGGTIFGSVFGGGEDGHVLGNTSVTIGDADTHNGPLIGTWGTSYVDGNVFGGGRGFNGEALTAGVVSGNVDLQIHGGTMLGSVYGGGRLASVGTYLVPPDYEKYGTFIPDGKDQIIGGEDVTAAGKTHGRIKVSITGGVIGREGITGEGVGYSGNVFGGSMGRLTLLSDDHNPEWARQAIAETSTVNITGGTIHRSVYGGGEYGTIRDNSYVTIGGSRDPETGTVTPSGSPVIDWNVYGGGYGSDNDTDIGIIDLPEYSTAYKYTPMQWAGCVGGNTNVNILGGWVKRNVYGGGDLASVGALNFAIDNVSDKNYTAIIKHDDPENGFALSWPYELPYLQGGKATINISGGRIGVTGKDYMGNDDGLTEEQKNALREDNGDVYGGSKGRVGDRYKYAFCANVKETEININYTSSTAIPSNYKSGVTPGSKGSAPDCIAGSVYGGGENGHVMENTSVTLTDGLVGHALYGGGKGKDTYTTNLTKAIGSGTYEAEVYSITAGKVYGNTNVSMAGGYVVRNIYGGGNMASVGKGNYAGGTDDYTPVGYGETLAGNLWTGGSANNLAFLNSGKATVNITGGTVGTPSGDKDDLPYGNVYGGCRGEAAAEVMGLDKNPTIFVGFINETEVNIGDALGGPTILGSVYGGGQDGHVRRETAVTINNGTIGLEHNSDNQTAVGTADITHFKWRHRGNVYGGGSGIGTYTFDYNGDGDSDDTSLSYKTYTVNEQGFSSSAGHVTHNTSVTVKGGTIYRNVYGGGSLASVSSPNYNPSVMPNSDDSEGKGKKFVNLVNIQGGTIGNATDQAAGYGGNVFGASRGETGGGISSDYFALASATEVNIKPNATPANSPVIYGNVYGGGELGKVITNTKVYLMGGTIHNDAYGGGKGTEAVAADIGGNATIELNGKSDAEGNVTERVANSARGCVVKRIYGGNDLNGTPRGHVQVHVHATQNKDKTRLDSKYAKFEDVTRMENADHDTYMRGLATTFSVPLPDGYEATMAKTTWDDLEGDTEEAQKAQLQLLKDKAFYELRSAIADKKYDVLVVYGGGNLAAYQPYGPQKNNTSEDFVATTEKAEVIIDGCELTSIRQVYGGGNAASTPANLLNVYGTYEIDELFGGGNGRDPFVKADGKYYANPGANVGYYNFMEYVTDNLDAAKNGDGSAGSPYIAHQKSDATSPEYRQAYYGYGTGIAETNVYGGRIHTVFGGSNEKGNIREMALSVFETSTECPVIVDKSFGAGKNAEIDGEVRVSMNCVDYIATQFGGSDNAPLHSNVNLTITNGHFGKVFGGNNTSGNIYGSITVNVKEEGCKPIVIENLYGGGYLAGYSVYGYNNDNSPRTKAQFETARTAALAGVDASDEDAVNAALLAAGLYGFPKQHPQVNVISATKIGNVFGGGYSAVVIGDPHVNINMEEGHISAKFVDETPADFTDGEHTLKDDGVATSYKYFVNRHVAEVGSTNGMAVLAIGTIDNVYGGGENADVVGDTHIEIGTGSHHVKEGDTVVLQALEPYRDVASIMNSVYGGGLGKTATVTGNTKISVGKGASVYNRIYGGGNLGSVGTATSTATHTGGEDHDGCIGVPTAFAENTGLCTIDVHGGYVGPFSVTNSAGVTQVRTPIPMTMPEDYGYVFGACRGAMESPLVNPDVEFTAFVNSTNVRIRNGYVAGHDDEPAYLTKPLIAGGVYGGSEDGSVLNDTYVYIQGGQIGLGKNLTEAYDDAAFIDPTVTMVTDDNKLAACASWNYASPWLPYDINSGNGHYKTATYGPASTTGTDGHTFYGNVFGGGSGYFAYETAEEGVYEWLPKAGQVLGDTHVEISGGHILTNVYGGNELTNVSGTCHVTMTGGTVGVPRTLNEIQALPTICYLFGGGKGDQRVHFNKSTNVGHSDVNVAGGIIYGSVLGGGEDGHVMGNVTMNIGQDDGTGPVIGTWGTSLYDGNVFGGGRGFGGEAYTAGNVAGSIEVNIKGGSMLGNVFGGGRLASVGYGLYMESETEAATGHKMYGEMQEDGYDDWYKNESDEYVHPARANFKRGRVEMNISGGTIGNKYEFIMPAAGNIPGGLAADFKTWTPANWTTWKAHNHVPNTSYDTSNGRLLHTSGGNVFCGGMGRYYLLDGVTPITSVDWRKLGNVKSTELNISDGAWIMSNVYGGGELGAVVTYTDNTDPEEPVVEDESGTTTINITGGTIGTEITDVAPVKATIPVTDSRSNVKYTFGSVFGGGYGTEAVLSGLTYTEKALWTGDVTNLGAYVEGNTYVNMSAGLVRASVFGGGDAAAVGGSTDVRVSGGRIGRGEVKPKADPDAGYVLFGGATMGNVFGAGKGSNSSPLIGVVRTNTKVTISAGAVEGEPFIYHNVYGGGALGSVGIFHPRGDTDPPYVPLGVPYGWTRPDFSVTDDNGISRVTITGGTIGITGRDNGMVNGSSRGDVAKPEYVTGSSATSELKDPYDRFAWVNKSYVTIGTSGASTGPAIKGSIYGGGENGHNNNDATVTLYSGTVGIVDPEDPWYDFGTGHEALLEKSLITRGNIYGAGCGTDTYTGDDGLEHNNPWSGCVIGNTHVNIHGGWVAHNVYGGGSMGSVGVVTNNLEDAASQHTDPETTFAKSWPYIFTYKTVPVPESNGITTVNVTGGRIGTTGSDNGDVYGGARGKAGAPAFDIVHPGSVKKTVVNINFAHPGSDVIKIVEEEDSETSEREFKLRIDEKKAGALVNAIAGSVYGGGEDGLVYESTDVTLTNGLIGHSVYGGGKGKGKYAPNPLVPGTKAYSIIAGKVYGNTSVTMEGGQVMRNIYGGGNLGSIGKGNYAGGADDYRSTGYGEKIAGNLWDNVSDDSKAFLGSGIATVDVKGGIIGFMPQSGTVVTPLGASASTYGAVMAAANAERKALLAKTFVKDDLPTGNIFGGCRGLSAAEDDVTNIMLGYINESAVTIGGTSAGPRIYGSVYGGGQDGHVRRSTNVTVNKGEIGIPYNTATRTLMGTIGLANPSDELDSKQWLHRGNIYGGGSGIGTYKDGGGVERNSSSAGSVIQSTTITVGNDIDGVAGTESTPGNVIYRNIYGGGSLASVCPLDGGANAPDPAVETRPGWLFGNTLNISGTVGVVEGYNEVYGGEVYGGSRGQADVTTDYPEWFALSTWTQVNIKNGAHIMGNVFGGGDHGTVKKDTRVVVGAE